MELKFEIMNLKFSQKTFNFLLKPYKTWKFKIFVFSLMKFELNTK